MAGLPSVPGLPQKPVHTNLPMTRNEREAAAAAAEDREVSTEGGVPPRRPAFSERPARRSAEPRASNNYTSRPPARESQSSFRGDQSYRHPYSRPRGEAVPTTPALLQQSQAAPQRRAENPFSIRPDREPAARGASKLARLPRGVRGQQPAGQASEKPQGDRDGKMTDPVTTTTAKRKASAPAPPSPSPSNLEEGEVSEEGEIIDRPAKRQRTASVAASASSASSSRPRYTDKTNDKGNRATPGCVSSPVASAAAAPTPTSCSATRKTARKSSGPVPRPSSSSGASRASGTAATMAWGLSLGDDDDDAPAVSSGLSPASDLAAAVSVAAPAAPANESVAAADSPPASVPRSARKSVPASRPTSAQKSPAPKTGGVKTGRVSKSKSKAKVKSKAKPFQPESDHPTHGGKTTWPGGCLKRPLETVSFGGVENDQTKPSSTNDVDDACVCLGGFQDNAGTAPTATSSAPKTSSSGEEATVSVRSETVDDNTLLGDASENSSPHVASPLVAPAVSEAPAHTDEDNGAPIPASPALAEPQSSTEPIVLSNTNDAVWIEVQLGSAVRQIQVDAVVLLVFSTWRSGSEPDQPLYNLDLSGVLADANQRSERQITAAEVLFVLLKILGEMEENLAGMGTIEVNHSSHEIWLAALMHGVLRLPQHVIDNLLSSLEELYASFTEEVFPQDHCLLPDAGFEKCIAAALIFGWEQQWRELMCSLTRSCGVCEADGQPLHYGRVLEENINKSTFAIVLGAHRQIILEATEKAIPFVQGYVQQDLLTETCSNQRCSTSRTGAIYSALTAGGLFPWPQEDQASLAGGRSLCEIAAPLVASTIGVTDVLDGTPNLQVLDNHVPGLCSGCVSPLANLEQEVGGVGLWERLAEYFAIIPFGGYPHLLPEASHPVQS